MRRSDTRTPTGKREVTVIAALAAGKTYAQAGRDAGLSRATVSRRMSDPEFRATVQQARSQLLEQATGKAASVATRAIQTLSALLGPQNPKPIRLGAARAVLEHVVRLREHGELSERLSQLEQIVAGRERVFGR